MSLGVNSVTVCVRNKHNLLLITKTENQLTNVSEFIKNLFKFLYLVWNERTAKLHMVNIH